MHTTLLLVAVIWAVIALAIWCVFSYKYANQSTELVIPPWLIIAAIAFWPVTIVAGILFFIAMGILTLFRWKGYLG
jgi:hypothetical protein